MLCWGHGVLIDSEVKLLGLGPAPPGMRPDVEVSFGRVPGNLEGATWSRICCKSNASQFLLDLQTIGAGRALAREGCQILLDSQWAEKPGLLHKVLMEDLMAAILMQRKILSFYGTVLAQDGEQCLILGPPAIGKSTLAAHLCDTGYSLVADGICAGRSLGGGVSIFRGNRRLKLWADAIERQCWDAKSCEKVRPNLDKYLAPEDGSILSDKTKVTRIYVMDQSQNAALPAAEILRGGRAVQTVAQFLAAPTFYQAWFLSVLGPLVNAASVYLIHLPRTSTAIDETIAATASIIKSQEGE